MIVSGACIHNNVDNTSKVTSFCSNRPTSLGQTHYTSNLRDTLKLFSFFSFFLSIFYLLCYYNCPTFSPLYSPSTCTHSHKHYNVPLVHVHDCTYKFFHFSISYTIFNIPLSVLYLPFMLLIPVPFPPSLEMTLHVNSIYVILFLFYLFA